MMVVVSVRVGDELGSGRVRALDLVTRAIWGARKKHGVHAFLVYPCARRLPVVFPHMRGPVIYPLSIKH